MGKSDGKWAAFKNLFTPISFQNSRPEKPMRRRQKQSKEMIMFHKLATDGTTSSVDDVLQGNGQEDNNEEEKIAEYGHQDCSYLRYEDIPDYRDIEQVDDLSDLWSPVTYSRKETDV